MLLTIPREVSRDLFLCSLSAEEYFNAASYHKDSNDDFLNKAKHLLESKPFEITTGCSNLGKLIKKRGNAVLREVHLLSAYMRLKPYSEMVLVGECKPEHDTCYLIAKSIARRFDKFIIVVFSDNSFSIVSNRTDITEFPQFSGSSKQIIINQVRDFAKQTIKDVLPSDIFKENGDFLWEKYYETQFLEQRLNVKLFRKFIPKYAMDKANMNIEKEFYEKVVEQRKEKHTLDFFFK
jgi:hypothetical protein